MNLSDYVRWAINEMNEATVDVTKNSSDLTTLAKFWEAAKQLSSLGSCQGSEINDFASAFREAEVVIKKARKL